MTRIFSIQISDFEARKMTRAECYARRRACRLIVRELASPENVARMKAALVNQFLYGTPGPVAPQAVPRFCGIYRFRSAL